MAIAAPDWTPGWISMPTRSPIARRRSSETVNFASAWCPGPTLHSWVLGGPLGAVKDASSINKRELPIDAQVKARRFSLGVLKGATTADVSAKFHNVRILKKP